LPGKDVLLSIDGPDILTGAPAVQQLGVTLRGSLKQLVLGNCDLSPDFWPAVWAHLPGLQQLKDKFKGASGATKLAFFSSRATRPLQLYLKGDRYREVRGKLGEQCQVWGVPQVTVA
jgi:hypothetical protein